MAIVFFAALILCGACGAVSAHWHRHSRPRALRDERRYVVIYALLFSSALSRAGLGWVRVQEVLLTAALLLHLYLVEGDDWNLVFFQLHFGAAWYLLPRHGAWLFVPHTAVVGVVIAHALRAKARANPAVGEEAGALLRACATGALLACAMLADVAAGWGYALLPPEPTWALALLRVLGEGGAVLGLWASVLCSELLRAAEHTSAAAPPPHLAFANGIPYIYCARGADKRI